MMILNIITNIKILFIMEDTTQKMLSQLHKEVINGIVANFFDFGKRPTVQNVKSNWQYQYYNIANDNTICDNVINTIINNVAKYYNLDD